MNIEILLLLGAGLGFLLVSLAFAGKIVVDTYLEYIQVKHGINVITMKRYEDYMDKLGEEEDETFN